MVEKALETGIYLQRGPAGEPGRGLVYRGLCEMYERDSSNGASLSLKDSLRRAPLLGILCCERKSLGTGISLQVGNLEWARLSGTMRGGWGGFWRRGVCLSLSMGAL